MCHRAYQPAEDHYRRRRLFDRETSETILVSPTDAKHHRFEASLMIIFKPKLKVVQRLNSKY